MSIFSVIKIIFSVIQIIALASPFACIFGVVLVELLRSVPGVSFEWLGDAGAISGVSFIGLCVLAGYALIALIILFGLLVAYCVNAAIFHSEAFPLREVRVEFPYYAKINFLAGRAYVYYSHPGIASKSSVINFLKNAFSEVGLDDFDLKTMVCGDFNLPNGLQVYVRPSCALVHRGAQVVYQFTNSIGPEDISRDEILIEIGDVLDQVFSSEQIQDQIDKLMERQRKELSHKIGRRL